MSGENYKVFKAAFLHNKFGTHNSIMVPNQRVVLNEDFIDLHDIIRVPSQNFHFRVYGIYKGINGSACIPGEWNYCYIDGKFYHLVKGESNGFIKGVEQEGFYYSILYDEWQNEGLTNNFQIKGTIDLTGDKELARSKINMIPPIIDNVNRFTHLDGIRYTHEEIKYETVLKLPEEPNENFQYDYTFTSFEKQRINDLLKDWHGKMNRGEMPNEPPMDKLHIPFLYRFSKSTNGKGHLLSEIKRHHELGFEVFDVSVAGLKDVEDIEVYQRRLFKKFHTDQLYTVASAENRVYTYAKAVNPTKGVPLIDLSGCTDITYLDGNDLEPFDRPTRLNGKNWNLTYLVDEVCRKLNGTGDSLKEKMKEVFDEVCFPEFAPILEHYDENRDGKSDISDFETKLFGNVTLEKIDRDVIDIGDVRGERKNPEGLAWLPDSSRIHNYRNHLNSVWDNSNSLAIVQGFRNDLFDRSPDREGGYIGRFNYDTASTESKESAKKALQEGNYTGRPYGSFYSTTYYKLNPDYNYFIYLPNEFKLTTEDKNKDHLDFTKNNFQQHSGFGLIPDYHTKSYLPAFRSNGQPPSSEPLDTEPRLILDYVKNSLHRQSVFCNKEKPGERCRLTPFILSEVKKEESQDIGLDGQKAGADYYEAWLNLGKDVTPDRSRAESTNGGKHYEPNDWRHLGARILSRGLAFMAAADVSREYTYFENIDKDIKGKLTENEDIPGLRAVSFYGRSDCTAVGEGKQNRPAGQYKCYSTTYSGPGTAYGYGKSYPRKTKAIYKNPERTGRDYQVEFTFPLKVDGFDILAKLKEFDGLPDEFFRGEVINTNKRKGAKPPVNVRILKQLKPGDDPMGVLATDEEQAKIAPNTVVRVYFMNMPLLDNSEDALYDKAIAIHKVFSKNKSDFGSKLIAGLCNYFFLEEGERADGAEPAGAIPNRIQVLDPNDYPKNEHGQHQLALNYGKPFHGFGYMAGVRFYAPLPNKELMRDVNNPNNFIENGNRTNDGFIAIVPENYSNSGNGIPRQSYRDKVTEIQRNSQLAFMYSGLVPIGTRDTNNTPASFGESRGVINPENEIPSMIYELNWFNESYDTGIQANKYHEEWNGFIRDGDTLLLSDFIRNAKTYSTKKLLNPEKIPPVIKYKQTDDIDKEITTSSLDKDIPPFMIEYLDPKDIRSGFHQTHTPPAATTDKQRIDIGKEHLKSMCRHTLEGLESYPIWFKFEGTDWYCAVKLNTRANHIHWDYELFTDNPQLIKTKDKEKGNFVNNFHDSDVDVQINSKFVLDVYGTKFNLKGRSFDKGDEIDIGLTVKPIEDEKQSLAAVGYSVHLNGGDVDVLETIVETPKELVKYTNFTHYERERLIRDLGILQQEYLYDQQVIDFNRRENKFMQEYEEAENYTNGRYSVGRGGTQIAVGLLGTAESIIDKFTFGGGGGLNLPAGSEGGYANKNKTILPDRTGTFNPYTRMQQGYHGFTPPGYDFHDLYRGRGRPPIKRYEATTRGSPHHAANGQTLGSGFGNAFSVTGMLGSVVQGGLAIGEGYERGYNEDARIKASYALAEVRLAAQGDIINKRHEHDKMNLLFKIYRQSANVVHPSMNRNLVYKLYNKENRLKDVHMTVFYPGGKLKEYLNTYYREYGYEILEEGYICYGAASVPSHLRYQFIYEINHTDEVIKEMIRSRALMGIKVINGVQ